MRTSGQILAARFEVKSSQRERAVVRGCAVAASLREGRGGGDFRAARSSAAQRSSATAASEPVSKELRPQRRGIPEEADPGVRDNAREVTVIRMARLRSAFPVFRKRSLHARPRVSHL